MIRISTALLALTAALAVAQTAIPAAALLGQPVEPVERGGDAPPEDSAAGDDGDAVPEAEWRARAEAYYRTLSDEDRRWLMSKDPEVAIPLPCDLSPHDVACPAAVRRVLSEGLPEGLMLKVGNGLIQLKGPRALLDPEKRRISDAILQMHRAVRSFERLPPRGGERAL